MNQHTATQLMEMMQSEAYRKMVEQYQREMDLKAMQMLIPMEKLLMPIDFDIEQLKFPFAQELEDVRALEEEARKRELQEKLNRQPRFGL